MPDNMVILTANEALNLTREIAQLKSRISELEFKLRHADKSQVKEKKEHIKKENVLKLDIQGKAETITGLVETIKGKDAAIAEKDQTIKQKDYALAEAGALVFEINKEKAALQTSMETYQKDLAETQALLLEKNIHITHIEDEVVRLSAVVLEKDQTITTLESELVKLQPVITDPVMPIGDLKK